MKFQNITIPGSKVMLCTRKHDERTNECTHARTNGQARSNMPHNFFQSWGDKDAFYFLSTDMSTKSKLYYH